MHIFIEQAFIDIHTEIHIDISHFKEDTKQSSATCRNPEKPQSIQSVYSSLNKDQLKIVLN